MNKIFTLMVLFLPLAILAQSPFDALFGNFSESEKAATDCPFEPGAPAMVLLDKGRTYNTFSSSGVALQSTHHRYVRIKILTTEGLKYANIEIPYRGDDWAFVSLNATVFTSNNEGKWVRHDPKSEDVHDEVVDAERGLKIKKIALPNVKVGSIIEYHYSMKVNRLEDWYFQWEIPVIKSEFTSLMSQDFHYYPMVIGNHPVVKKEEAIEKRTAVLRTTTNPTITKGTTIVTSNGRVLKKPAGNPAPSSPIMDFSNHTWTAVNVPSYRKEPFQAARKQHISHLRFLLKAVNIGGNLKKDYASTYPEFVEKLLTDPDFGKHLKAKSSVLAKLDIEASGNAEEDTKLIFSKIAALKWDGTSAFIPDKNPQKTIKKGGNSAALNMLLIVALREAGIQAFPVISYEWKYGKPDKEVPHPTAYDFLLCAVDFGKKEGSYTFLDVSASDMPFGQLPLYAVNGEGLLVDAERQGWVDLHAGALYEQASGVKLRFEEGKIKGEIKSRLKGYAKMDFLSANDRQREQAEKHFKDQIPEDWTVSNWQVSADDKEQPVDISATLEKEVEMEDIIYLEPILMRLFAANPFNTVERISPVDFRHEYRYKYAVSIELPEGYVIEELPEKTIFQMPEGHGKFVLSPSQRGNQVQFNVMFSLEKTYYNPQEEYATLREFITRSFEKMEGIIVLKKVE